MTARASSESILSATAPTATAKDVARDHRDEILGRIYDVALDPTCLEALIDCWETHFGATRAGPAAAALLDDAVLNGHLARAGVFLERHQAAREHGGYRSVLADIPRSAAFLSDGGPGIVAFNRPAAMAFGLREASQMADLPFEPEDIDLLRRVCHQVVSGRVEQAMTLRIHSKVTGGPVIVRVGPVDGQGTKPLALVMSNEQVWPLGFEATIQAAFALTKSELEIVRGVTLGQALREIAEARGRSTETVRTQMRSILAKTETHSQAELVRAMVGLMDVAMMPSEEAPAALQGSLDPLVFQHLRGPDGRRLEWIEFGNPSGAPLLFMHQDLGFIRWPARAERAARQRGIRVIVPVRAGYGRSELHRSAAGAAGHLDAVVADYLSVADYIGIQRAAVLSLGADLRFAMRLAEVRPSLVTGILGCAAQLPHTSGAHYARMNKWPRFVLGNARYAPGVVPFAVQAGFMLARQMGKENYYSMVNGGSVADTAAFMQPEIREAILAGSEVTLSAKISAHEAFAREALGSEQDWSEIVRNCRVPVVLMQGDQDAQAPLATLREQVSDYPNLELKVMNDAGRLVFFVHWQSALEILERFLPRR
jgi:pimeloyl-ACP methyl ester carboxylesterase/DNA-binding CsgD family transcriptional regulator